MPEANCRMRRHAHVRHCLQRIRRATLVRRRELEAEDAKDLTCATCISKPTLAASASQMRNADAQCLPADRVGSAVPDNATAASAQARMRSRPIGVAVAHPGALIDHDLRATEPEAGE
ncbi:hypothetical protein L2221_20495, partial [Xanthomonas perforans]|nr:hypothetical protein [Xanthomonas perforans]